VEVVIDYAPREQFLPLHERKTRWLACVAHRRAGKTVACVQELNKEALTTPRGAVCLYRPALCAGQGRGVGLS